MAEVEDDEVRLRPWKRPSIARRGHTMQVTLAKIELAMDGLVAVEPGARQRAARRRRRLMI
jgi:hypothetical protein